jgi:hypothetical protein
MVKLHLKKKTGNALNNKEKKNPKYHVLTHQNFDSRQGPNQV